MNAGHDGAPAGTATEAGTGMVDAYVASHRRRAQPARFDEMVGFHGQLRAGWGGVASMAETVGTAGLVDAAADTGRRLAEDGVAYRPFNSPGERAWEVDPLPVIVDEGEWTSLEQALAQRALLMDRLLADLYGPRNSIRQGLLPMEIVFGHPGFVRGWDQAPAPGARQLFLCGTDLARVADGGWCVLADRVQAPSGPGYAMAGRRAVSRALTGLHERAEIHRLAPFFHAMRRSLDEMVPEVPSPRIVLLTPGPHSETAFEQTFLSGLLGYPLVQGSDLLVADGRVWQRALGRLEPVHVILRRVDSWYCDPLDLLPGSRLGVPGLLEAARAGTVIVLNSLGSGVLENPALMPFLPGLAALLIDEPLRLRSAPTWWCGDPLSRHHVLARMDELVLKPLGRRVGASAVFGARCSVAEREQLRRRIEAEPYAWVGQEVAACSTTPTVADSGLAARDLTLRGFSVATGSGYRVMSGGLAHVAGTSSAAPAAKDVWVGNTRAAPAPQPWAPEAPPTPAQVTTAPPRVAEDMFWLGRYAERAEATARLLRAVDDLWSDVRTAPDPPGREAMAALTRAAGEVTGTGMDPPPGPGTDLGVVPALLSGLIVDESRPGTVAYAVHRMIAVAQDVREQLSQETWPLLGSLQRALHHGGSQDANGGLPTGPSPTLAAVLERLLALAGLSSESLVRDDAWRFLDTGRRLERALAMTWLLAATLGTEGHPDRDSLVLEAVLAAGDSVITHRRRYRSRSGAAPVLDLLLTDPDNPRGVAYQLDRTARTVDRLPGPAEGMELLRAQLATLRAELHGCDTVELARAGAGGDRASLRRLLEGLSSGLIGLADSIDHTFFVHTPPQRPLAGSVGSW